MILKFVRKQRQFIAFALIGVANTFVHGALLMLCVEILKITVVAAHFFAFSAANIVSYVLNSTLTFRMNLSMKRYAKFYIASMGSLGLTLSLSWLIDAYGAHYLLGFLIIVVVVPVISFFLMKFWAFADLDSDGKDVVSG